MLRDQLVTDVDDLVSPNPDVALIDEADSVLVDEALVPLVLAGTTHRETPKVEIIRMVGELTAGADYDTDADNRNVHLTEAGAQKLEAKLGGIDLYSEEHVGTTLTEVNVALHAHVLLQRDVALHRPRRRRAPDQRLTRPHRATAALARRGHRNPAPSGHLTTVQSGVVPQPENCRILTVIRATPGSCACRTAGTEDPQRAVHPGGQFHGNGDQGLTIIRAGPSGRRGSH